MSRQSIRSWQQQREKWNFELPSGLREKNIPGLRTFSHDFLANHTTKRDNYRLPVKQAGLQIQPSLRRYESSSKKGPVVCFPFKRERKQDFRFGGRDSLRDSPNGFSMALPMPMPTLALLVCRQRPRKP